MVTKKLSLINLINIDVFLYVFIYVFKLVNQDTYQKPNNIPLFNTSYSLDIPYYVRTAVLPNGHGFPFFQSVTIRQDLGK